IKKITGIEVTYPQKTPPYRLMLSNPFGEGSSNGPIPFFVLPATFTHRLEKTLTASDVETGTLVYTLLERFLPVCISKGGDSTNLD
ncbi:hypothetical protein A2U01_0053049, partial [Trifolium medium]|nr:hypothetical protein [Trifolium medium]